METVKTCLGLLGVPPGSCGDVGRWGQPCQRPEPQPKTGMSPGVGALPGRGEACAALKG